MARPKPDSRRPSRARRKDTPPSSAPASSATAPAEPASWVLLAVLLISTLAAYAPVWHGGILWDDITHLTVRELRSTAGLWRIWFDVGATQQYYPVVHSAFWVMHRLWGDNTLGYHLVTISLHALSAWLVAVILRKLAVPGAWLAAVIFALHPVHVESVAWMTELKNTLSGVFYLLAALMYLDFDARRKRLAYVAALGLFVLALLSKTVTATLPAALLVVFWWQRGRIDLRRDVRPLVPFFVLGLLGGVATAWIERTFIGAVGSDFQIGPIERGLLVGRALWFYFGKLVWPANLLFMYPRWTLSAAAAWQYLFPVAALGVGAIAWFFRSRSRAPLAACLFFAGTLLPALGFVDVYPFRYSFVADHFQYLASLGMITLGSAGIVILLRRLVQPIAMLEAVACAVVALPLGVLTWHQSAQYADARTLYETTIQRNPECWMAYNNLAAIEVTGSAAERAQALVHVETSLRLNPANAEAHNNLGLIYLKDGRAEEAMREHREAIRLKPRFSEAYSNLATDAHALGMTEEALRYDEEALRLTPFDASRHQNLGVTLQDIGRIDEAVVHIREALRLDPKYAEAHDNLGTAYSRQGRADEAIAEYREAIRLQPDFGEAHNNLGSVLLGLGRFDEAIVELHETVRLKPDSGMPHDNLARALLGAGRRADALAQLREAIRIEPTYGPAREQLAGVFLDSHQFADAVAAYNEALKYVPTSAEAHNNLGVALASLGRPAEAVPHFAEALRLRPDFSQARANLARARGGR